MKTETGKFIITRADLNVDPLVLVTDGLKIGRLPSCELVLNHPAVSRLHAGINQAEGRFYLFNFSHSSATSLNGRVIPPEEAEVLADGDLLQIGPFFLRIERDAEALRIRVTLEMATKVGEAEARGLAATTPPPAANTGAARTHRSVTDALNVFWEKRKREAGKMQRLSALRPQAPARVVGKARFNWTPTRDLVRPWPVSAFIWGAIIVCALSFAAALGYTRAFSPAPLSAAHARASLQLQPAVAARPNAGSCTTCHALRASMESSCAACHRTANFAADITRAHREAGITCVDCHAEHRGAEFRPAVAGVASCASCHTDSNRHLYGGRSVHTPHGGTFGYPVVGGRWIWAGLDASEWAEKPAELRAALARMEESARAWPVAGDAGGDRQRSAEFHALHLNRVKAVAGLRGNREGELSCSSCHQRFAPIDRETPRTTCQACHAGDRSGRFADALAPDRPNCVSCHVQHVQDGRAWAAMLLVDAPHDGH